MESMFLLIPLSVALVLVIGGVLAWAVMSGQFEDLEAEGTRILQDEGEDAAGRSIKGAENKGTGGSFGSDA
jgi:cbb3-type cytochrome oxidase maturation protein